MASCLGLYIEKNLIKYAKVSNSNDVKKIESFGVKFYDNIQNAIKQIIDETYSYKIPIAINLPEEIYTKMEVFNLLSKKDMEGVIKTEFENRCYTKDENPAIYDQRYIFANTNIKSEKIKVIHISSQKASIVQAKNQFVDYKISNISPIGIAIQDIIKKENKLTTLVVNIEKNTTLTKLYNNMVSDVSVINIGAQDIIEKINQKENSYSKAYEICKNSTIYTEQDKDLQYEENEYLVDIMPTLYQIATEIKKITEESLEKIDKIYITGTGAIINNVDIYFQETLANIPCEILKPNFVSNSSKINIKDYIEVNSAVALAIQMLEKNNAINFTKESVFDKTKSVFKTNLSLKNVDVSSDVITDIVNKYRRQYNVIFLVVLFLTATYCFGSFTINNKMEEKQILANNSIGETQNRIREIKKNYDKFNDKIRYYETLIKNIENVNDINSENKRFRNTIPNLLNNIMAVIPKEVQLILIENTSDTHIVIAAKTKRYEQIAFFKTKLKTEGILKNVVSDTGTMEEGYLTVIIEGELP